jgi:hypothetical protein
MYHGTESGTTMWQWGPETKRYHLLITGVICLQLSVSNESVVVLRKVGFNLSGNFSCEVTVEAPSFSTATVYQHMLVVCK